MARHIALLRGINVGGKNKLPMADLRGIFEDLGCTDVTTYIQSGNVAFGARGTKTLAARVSKAIEERLGLDVPVVLRSAGELREAMANHPYTDSAVEEKWRSIMFLAGAPSRAQRNAFDPDTSCGERYELIGSEVHIEFPEGLARSKFTNTYVDRALATVSTTRNWRTVTKLLEMVEAD